MSQHTVIVGWQMTPGEPVTVADPQKRCDDQVKAGALGHSITPQDAIGPVCEAQDKQDDGELADHAAILPGFGSSDAKSLRLTGTPRVISSRAMRSCHFAGTPRPCCRHLSRADSLAFKSAATASTSCHVR